MPDVKHPEDARSVHESIRRISPFAFDDLNERLRSMREQAELQQMAYIWTGDPALSRKPFVVMQTAAELDVEPLGDKPVVMRHRDIKHVLKRYSADGQPPLSYEELFAKIEGLSEELRNHVFAFEDPNCASHVCLVLDKISRGGNWIIAVADSTANIATVDVVDIITIHGRDDLFERINQSAAADLGLYPNSRTGAWLESSAETPRETTKRLLERLYHPKRGTEYVSPTVVATQLCQLDCNQPGLELSRYRAG